MISHLFPLFTLAVQFAPTTHGFGGFTRFFHGRLFVVTPHLDFAKQAFALHLFLEDAKRLFDVIVTDIYANDDNHLLSGSGGSIGAGEKTLKTPHPKNSLKLLGPVYGAFDPLLQGDPRQIYPASRSLSSRRGLAAISMSAPVS